jgi:hypothetical protein
MSRGASPSGRWSTSAAEAVRGVWQLRFRCRCDDEDSYEPATGPARCFRYDPTERE